MNKLKRDTLIKSRLKFNAALFESSQRKKVAIDKIAWATDSNVDEIKIQLRTLGIDPELALRTLLLTGSLPDFD